MPPLNRTDPKDDALRQVQANPRQRPHFPLAKNRILLKLAQTTSFDELSKALNKASRKIKNNPQGSAEAQLDGDDNNGAPGGRQCKKSTISVQEDILDNLECPVCLETPREAPVFNCANGHTLCGSCKVRVPSCPVCKNGQMFRNIFAEKILGKANRERRHPCKYARYGCERSDRLDALKAHERSQCAYAPVKCPGRHRKACNWEGNVRALLKHINDNKCAQMIVGHLPLTGEYKSCLGDFAQPGLSVLDRKAHTQWKPILLLSPRHVKILPYVIISRSAQGIWTVCVRGMAGEERLRDWRADITVRKRGDDRGSLRLNGTRVHADGATDKMVEDSGSFMILADGQVRDMCSNDGRKFLFQYEVRLWKVDEPQRTVAVVKQEVGVEEQPQRRDTVIKEEMDVDVVAVA